MSDEENRVRVLSNLSLITYHSLFHFLAREDVLRGEVKSRRDREHDEDGHGVNPTVEREVNVAVPVARRGADDPVEDVAADEVEHPDERDGSGNDRNPPLLEEHREEERRRIDHQPDGHRPDGAAQAVRDHPDERTPRAGERHVRRRRRHDEIDERECRKYRKPHARRRLHRADDVLEEQDVPAPDGPLEEEEHAAVIQLRAYRADGEEGQKEKARRYQKT